MVVNPVARQSRFHKVMRRQHDDGLRRPLANSVRPPQI